MELKKKIRYDSKKTNFNLNNSDFAVQNWVHLADELTFLGMSLTIVDRSDQNHMEKKKWTQSQMHHHRCYFLFAFMRKGTLATSDCLFFSFIQVCSCFPSPEKPDWGSLSIQMNKEAFSKDCHYKFVFVQESCLIEGRPQQI